MKIGDRIKLTAVEIAAAVSSLKKDRHKVIGLLADAVVRPLIEPLGWMSNPDKFGPYDASRDGRYIDIKVTWGKTLTFSFSEQAFAERNPWSVLVLLVVGSSSDGGVTLECIGTAQHEMFPQIHSSQYGDKLYVWINQLKLQPVF